MQGRKKVSSDGNLSLFDSSNRITYDLHSNSITHPNYTKAIPAVHVINIPWPRVIVDIYDEVVFDMYMDILIDMNPDKRLSKNILVILVGGNSSEDTQVDIDIKKELYTLRVNISPKPSASPTPISPSTPPPPLSPPTPPPPPSPPTSPSSYDSDSDDNDNADDGVEMFEDVEVEEDSILDTLLGYAFELPKIKCHADNVQEIVYELEPVRILLSDVRRCFLYTQKDLYNMAFIQEHFVLLPLETVDMSLKMLTGVVKHNARVLTRCYTKAEKGKESKEFRLFQNLLLATAISELYPAFDKHVRQYLYTMLHQLPPDYLAWHDVAEKSLPHTKLATKLQIAIKMHMQPKMYNEIVVSELVRKFNPRTISLLCAIELMVGSNFLVEEDILHRFILDQFYNAWESLPRNHIPAATSCIRQILSMQQQCVYQIVGRWNVIMFESNTLRNKIFYPVYQIWNWNNSDEMKNKFKIIDLVRLFCTTLYDFDVHIFFNLNHKREILVSKTYGTGSISSDDKKSRPFRAVKQYSLNVPQFNVFRYRAGRKKFSCINKNRIRPITYCFKTHLLHYNIMKQSIDKEKDYPICKLETILENFINCKKKTPVDAFQLIRATSSHQWTIRNSNNVFTVILTEKIINMINSMIARRG